MAFMHCHAVQEQLEHESREMLLFLPSPDLGAPHDIFFREQRLRDAHHNKQACRLSWLAQARAREEPPQLWKCLHD